MKLSNREKNMIVVFGFILIAVAVFFFVVDPIHAANKIAREENQIVESQYRIVKTQVKEEKEIEAVIGDYRDRLSYLESKLPAQVYLEKIIDDIYNHFESYDITIESVAFSLIESSTDDDITTENENGELAIENLRPVMSVEEILSSYEDGEDMSESVIVNDEEIIINYAKIGYMNVGLSFQANYNVYKDALEALSLLDTTVIPTNMSLSKATFDEEADEPDNNKVFVALTVGIPFYYDNEALEDIFFDYEFEPSNDFEEHGPFEYVEIQNLIGVTSSGGINVASITPDIEISLRNSSSDLAAQSIAYNLVNTSAVELDGNRSERYSLELVESNGGVSFRYSNDISSFPSSGYQILESSNDNIIVRVNASTRVNTDDAAGMTLVLNNNTNKSVLFYVFNDDGANPRFNVIVNSGSFDIIRN